jgi:hypothetical protein
MQRVSDHVGCLGAHHVALRVVAFRFA